MSPTPSLHLPMYWQESAKERDNVPLIVTGLGRQSVCVTTTPSHPERGRWTGGSAEEGLRAAGWGGGI